MALAFHKIISILPIRSKQALERKGFIQMIIDFHVHAFPDKVAAKAIETLESIYGEKAFSDGTIAGLLKSMAESGVDYSVIQSVSTAPRQVVSINTWISELPQSVKEHSDKIPCPLIGFGTIHPKFEGYRDEIQRMKELGIKGVKFQPSFQEFYPDDERMFPVYEEIIKAGLIILFHAGDEIRPAPLVYSTPQRLGRLLDAMQNDIDLYNYRINTNGPIKFIAAHIGGYKMWDQVEEHLLGREIFFDASYFFGHFERNAIKFLRSHGVEKILFASDHPFAQQQKDIKALLSLDMTNDEKTMILESNAANLLKLE
jgi:predicted TIM-barrel fold metal-dependent hydrolase